MPHDSNTAALRDTQPLSSTLVDELLHSGQDDVRIDIAWAVGNLLAGERLNPSELELAVDVLTVLARDIQEQVRAAVARSVMSSSLLPRNLACQLANDVETVALPILKAAKVLSDNDLIEIVKGGNLEKQLAIAGREDVGSRVVGALLEVDRFEVTTAVVENAGSEITEEQYHLIMAQAGNQPALRLAMAERIHLPASVTAKLIDVAAEGILDRLVTSQGIPTFLADQVIDCAREALLTEQTSEETSEDSLISFVRHLRSQGKLTETLLLRALLEGYVPFFETAFAELANIPVRNARAIMYYGGGEGLRKLFARTKLSESLYLPLQVGARFIRETREEHKDGQGVRWSQDFTEKLIQLLVKIDRRFQYGTVEQIVSKFRYDLDNERPAEASPRHKETRRPELGAGEGNRTLDT